MGRSHHTFGVDIIMMKILIVLLGEVLEIIINM